MIKFEAGVIGSLSAEAKIAAALARATVDTEMLEHPTRILSTVVDSFCRNPAECHAGDVLLALLATMELLGYDIEKHYIGARAAVTLAAIAFSARRGEDTDLRSELLGRLKRGVQDGELNEEDKDYQEAVNWLSGDEVSEEEGR